MALRTPLTVSPYMYIGDSTGRPLDYGMVYFGEPNKDPEFYPIDIFLDEEMTLPLGQPVRTKGGFMYGNGDMVEVHAVEVVYSVKVLDQYGRKILYKGEMYRNNVSDFLVDEITRATEAEEAIASNLGDEVDRATTAEGIIATNLSNEVTRATNAESAINNSLSSLDTSYKDADNALQVQIDSVGGGNIPYPSYSAMVADKGNITTKMVLEVTNDPSPTNNGRYSYNGTDFLKSAYNPEAIILKKVSSTFETKADMVGSPLPDNSYATVVNDYSDNNGDYKRVSGYWLPTEYQAVAEKNMEITGGSLLLITDNNGNPTWLQANNTDGGLTDQSENFVREKLNILKTTTSTVMFAITDDDDNLTDLSLDASGSIPNEVLDNWAERLKERGHLQSDSNKETKVQPDNYALNMPTQVGTAKDICIGDKYYKDGAYYPVSVDKSKVIMIGSSSIRYSATFIRTALTALSKGITSYQPGFAGAVIEHMYPLVGNRPITVIPENNKINATGTTTINLVESPSIKGGLANFDGWLSGIHGNLSEVGSDMVFTRTTNAASDTAINQAVQFIPDLGNQYRNAIQILWIGKNNLTSGNSLYNDVDQLIKGTDEMIEFSASMFKRFVVLTHYCNTDEPAVSEARDRINRCNDLYKQRYRDSVFDAEEIILGQQIFIDLGITKTTADDAAIAKRSLPPSLSKDAGHCTDAVYEYISNKLVEFMDNNNYFGA